MTKNLFFLLLLFSGIINAQLPEHSSCGNNKIENSTFDVDNDNSPVVTGWTFSPKGDSNKGWKKDKTLIYGTYLFIDRYGKHTASSNTMQLCTGGAKLVKFAYNSANVGKHSFKVKLGGQELISFSRHGGWAQSNASLTTGVSATINRKFLAEGSVNIGVPLGNNVWHDVVLYVSNYTGAISGELELEYEKTGYSRQIRIDNVEVYDALPKPELTNQTKELASCDATTADLTTGLYTPKPGFSYEWHTVGSNPSASTLVANPASAGIGIYYLYIKGSNSDCSTGGTTNCYSPASNVVSVTAKAGCCGGNMLTNPGFDDYLSTDWTLEGAAQLVSSTDYLTALGGDAKAWKTPPAADDTWMKLKADVATDPDGVLKRNDIELCPTTEKELSFDFVADEQTIFGDRRFIVSLAGKQLFYIWANNNSPHNLKFESVISGVTVSATREDGVTFTPANQASNFWQYSTESATLPYRYNIKVKIDPVTAGITTGTGKELKFQGYQYVNWYIDNISLSESKPAAASAISGSANANCATNTFDLTSVQPTTAGFKYIWYDGANPTTANRIAEPTKAEPGTYYMQTVSECSTCKSDDTTAFTVNQNCPIIKGTLYADYDGTTTNGINQVGATNSTAQGHSGGGLYALLVDNTNKVVRTTKINTDGSYQLSASSAANYRVMIHNKDIAVNSNAPTTSELNPSYVHTGSTVNGALNTNKTGISAQFNATANSSTIVNFGTNVQPIPSGGSLQECNNNGAEYKYTGTAPNATNTGLLLYGIDDDSTFNNGEGQKVIIKTLTQTAGVLKYGGNNITTVPHTIASYDKTKLTFTPNNATDEAKVEFAYVFEDKAGTESAAAAKISLTIAAKLDATIVSSVEGVCLNETSPVVTATGLNGVAPYTFEYNINGGATKTITTDATTPEDIPLEAIATTATGTFTYNITKVTDYIGCTTTFTTPKTLNVSVSEQPQDVTVIPQNSIICSGKDAIFNISGRAGDVLTYTLNNVAATATLDANGRAVVIVTAATANQTIALTKVSKGSCELALDKAITIVVKTTDSDGDGVPDWCDLDDDNDGILDTVESPNCVINETKVNKDLIGVPTSDFTPTTTHPLSNAIDRLTNGDSNIGTYSQFTVPADKSIVNKTIIGIPLTDAVRVKNVAITVGTTSSAGITSTPEDEVVLEGVVKGTTNWVRLSDTKEGFNSGATFTFINIYYPDAKISKIRIQGVKGEISTLPDARGIKDVRIVPYEYIKDNCTDDIDGDGVPNHLDLDSDNDGCPDAIEGSGDFRKANLVAAAGTVGNGTGSPLGTNKKNLCGNSTCVQSNGIPTVAGIGQGKGESQEAVKITITQNLQSTKEVFVGSQVSFTAKVEAVKANSFNNGVPNFTTSTTLKNIYYKWEVNKNNGGGFVFLESGYSTATTNPQDITLNLGNQINDDRDNYKYRLILSTAENNCSVVTNVLTLKLLNVPIKATSPNESVCMGADKKIELRGEFTAQGSVTSVSGWEWTTPGGNVLTGQNQTISPVKASDGGIYTLRATDNNGITHTTTLQIKVHTRDSDGDGVPDFCDKDSDNDGILDSDEKKGDLNPPPHPGMTGSGKLKKQLLFFDWKGKTFVEGVSTATTFNNVTYTATITNIQLDQSSEYLSPNIKNQSKVYHSTHPNASNQTVFPDISKGIKFSPAKTWYGALFHQLYNPGDNVSTAVGSSGIPLKEAFYGKLNFDMEITAVHSNGKSYPIDVFIFDSESSTSPDYVQFTTDGDGFIPFEKGKQEGHYIDTRGKGATKTKIIDRRRCSQNQDTYTIEPAANAYTYSFPVINPNFQPINQDNDANPRRNNGHEIYSISSGDKIVRMINTEGSTHYNDAWIYQPWHNCKSSKPNIPQYLSGTEKFSRANTLLYTTNVKKVSVEILSFSGPQAIGLGIWMHKDTDNDGVPDYLDLDSDNDGCPDAVEGSGDFREVNLVAAKGIVGNGPGSPLGANKKNLCGDSTCVNADGIPLIGGNPATQGVGKSTDNQVKSGCVCEKDGLSTGTPRITNIGISTLNRNTENWLSDGNQNKLGAYITLESKEKGFVITRNANPKQNIKEPKEGMMVWDTTDKCLKLFDGKQWKCIRIGCNE